MTNADEIIQQRMSIFMDEYHLTPLLKVAVQRFITKNVADVSNTKVSRVREWIMNKMNNKSTISPDLGQKGCPDIIPGLRARPFWDINEFSFIDDLKTAYSGIRDELLSLKDISRRGHAVAGKGRVGGLFQPYRAPTWATGKKASDSLGGNEGTSRGKWNVLYLQLHAHRFEENMNVCPTIMKLLNTIDHLYEHSFLSALTPGSHVMPHHGPTNKKLRVHLPLLGCEGARIRVGDQEMEMKEGIPYIFDDSFEHEVWHEGKSTRFVLIFDIWHPDLSKEEITFLSSLRNAKLRFEKELLARLEEEHNTQEDKFEDNTERTQFLEDNFFSLIDRASSALNANENFWFSSDNSNSLHLN